MLTVRARIAPLSAFGTLPKGDTLFGQLCWAVRNHFGEQKLCTLLESYADGRPFAAVSDAFPAGYLPRPILPGHWFTELAGVDRKEVKKRLWLPIEKFGESVENWLQHCRAAKEIPGGNALLRPQPHNVIDRRTGTTGDGFAPYAMVQHWYDRCDKEHKVRIELLLDIYIVLDEARLAQNKLEELLAGIGAFGFGRDASIGLGKFRLESLEQADLPVQNNADAWLTLAPCAPQGLELDPARSFYQVFTRFGRHGDIAVHIGNPFKTPVLLAQTAAVLAPKTYENRSLIGRGLGSDGSLSESIRETVHQGYAPVVGIRLPARKEASA